MVARLGTRDRRLRDFASRGELTIVSQLGDRQVADLVQRVAQSGKLPETDSVGVDPVGVGQLIDELAVRGLAKRIAGVSQGWKLNGAIKTLERKLARWHAGPGHRGMGGRKCEG
jgi:phage terminase large subunit-like protein